jgi:hypothetical protein
MEGILIYRHRPRMPRAFVIASQIRGAPSAHNMLELFGYANLIANIQVAMLAMHCAPHWHLEDIRELLQDFRRAATANWLLEEFQQLLHDFRRTDTAKWHMKKFLQLL